VVKEGVFERAQRAQKVQYVQEFNVFKGSGLDTPPASALDLLLIFGSWPLVSRGWSGRFSGCIEGMLSKVQIFCLWS